MAKKQTKVGKMSKQQKIDYINEALHRGLQGTEQGRCCIRVPQDQLGSSLVTDILSAITQQFIESGKFPEGTVSWPKDTEVGELLTVRIRTSMQNLLADVDNLISQMETVLQWLESVENTKKNMCASTVKYHNKRDSKGRFTKR